MVIQVKTPDGNIAQFPDGTPQATILSVMQKTYPPDRKAPYTVGGMVARDVTGKAPPGTDTIDSIKSFGSGVLSSLSNIADQMPGGTRSGAMRTGGSLGVLAAQKLGLANPQQAQQAQAFMRKALPTPDELQARYGLQHNPTTTAGRYAGALGAMLPNAIGGPEGAIPKIASVVIPALTSQGSRDVARMAGGTETTQNVAGVLGGVVGGVASGMRVGPRAVATPEVAHASALSKLAKASDDTVLDMASRYKQRVDSGVESTLADITTPAGRGLMEAAATRSAAARNLSAKFSESRQLNLPSRLGRQVGEIAPRSVPEAAQTPASMLAQTRQQIGPGSGGNMISDALNSRFDAANAAVNDAYSTARAARGDQAMIPRAEMPVTTANIRDAVSDFDMTRVPAVGRILDGIDKLSTPNIRDLFEARSKLSGLRVSNDTVESAAAGKASRALDTEIMRLEPHITGDPQAVQAWRTAIGQRRALGQQFEGNDLINSLTERTYHGGQMTNAVAPEDAVNTLLGRSPLGFVGKKDSLRDLTRIRDTVGPQSPEWHALRGEVVDRLIQASGGQDNLNVERLGRNLDTLGPYGDLLFSPPEMNQMRDAVAAGMRADPAVVGQSIRNTGTDDFLRQTGQLSPSELPIAQASAVRKLQQDFGNTTTPNKLARVVANTPEQQSRTRGLFPENQAYRMEAGIRLEEENARNAADINPAVGSRTHLRGQQQKNAEIIDNIDSAVGIGAKVVGGRPIAATIDGARLWLKAHGLTEAEAEHLVRISTDPRQTEMAFREISKLYGPTQARSILKALKPARLAPVATAAYLSSASAQKEPQ